METATVGAQSVHQSCDRVHQISFQREHPSTQQQTVTVTVACSGYRSLFSTKYLQRTALVSKKKALTENQIPEDLPLP